VADTNLRPHHHPVSAAFTQTLGCTQVRLITTATVRPLALTGSVGGGQPVSGLDGQLSGQDLSIDRVGDLEAARCPAHQPKIDAEVHVRARRRLGLSTAEDGSDDSADARFSELMGETVEMPWCGSGSAAPWRARRAPTGPSPRPSSCVAAGYPSALTSGVGRSRCSSPQGHRTGVREAVEDARGHRTAVRARGFRDP